MGFDIYYNIDDPSNASELFAAIYSLQYTGDHDKLVEKLKGDLVKEFNKHGFIRKDFKVIRLHSWTRSELKYHKTGYVGYGQFKDHSTNIILPPWSNDSDKTISKPKSTLDKLKDKIAKLEKKKEKFKTDPSDESYYTDLRSDYKFLYWRLRRNVNQRIVINKKYKIDLPVMLKKIDMIEKVLNQGNKFIADDAIHSLNDLISVIEDKIFPVFRRGIHKKENIDALLKLDDKLNIGKRIHNEFYLSDHRLPSCIKDVDIYTLEPYDNLRLCNNIEPCSYHYFQNEEEWVKRCIDSANHAIDEIRTYFNSIMDLVKHSDTDPIVVKLLIELGWVDNEE